jgi:hypothetical protein
VDEERDQEAQLRDIEAVSQCADRDKEPQEGEVGDLKVLWLI